MLAETLTTFGGVMVSKWPAMTMASPMAVSFADQDETGRNAAPHLQGLTRGGRSSPTCATRSSPACTARSASSSWPVGYPNNARISSPTKEVIAPPHLVTTVLQMSWKGRTMPKSSGWLPTPPLQLPCRTKRLPTAFLAQTGAGSALTWRSYGRVISEAGPVEFRRSVAASASL